MIKSRPSSWSDVISGSLPEVRSVDSLAGYVITCYSGLMWESSVGLSAALHLSVATRNISYGGDFYIPYFLMNQDIVTNPHKFEQGIVMPNNKEGLGVELDDRIIRKFKI